MARLGPAEDTYPYPEVTEELLAEMVRRILAVGDPERIVLFGSRARGDARRDSDIDLFIVEQADVPRWQRSSKYYGALRGLFPKKDIVVWTPTEVQAQAGAPLSFAMTALSEGRTMYERAA